MNEVMRGLPALADILMLPAVALEAMAGRVPCNPEERQALTRLEEVACRLSEAARQVRERATEGTNDGT